MDGSVNFTDPLLENEDDDSLSENENRATITRSLHSESEIKAPHDSYRVAYFTFYLLGILTLLPWNFFVTVNDYWLYKFRDVNSTQPSQNKTAMQVEFTSYITIAATGPSLFFLILNSIFSHKLSNHFRIVGSLVFILILFLCTTIFVDVNTDSWQEVFFAITLLTVVLLNIFSAILQAGLWGIASKFSIRYISAVVSGQALGGMFAAVVYIVSLAVGVSSSHSAMLYFNIANVTIIISLISYVYLSRSVFFKYHMLCKSPANTLQYDPADADERDLPPDVARVHLTKVLARMWQYGVAVLMCFTVTLSVYPAVTVLITSSDIHSEYEKYFVPVIAFLIFSIWDYVGRILAGCFIWPTKRPWLVLGFSFIRIVFIPLMMLCNAHPRHLIPVLIPNDSYYIAITCLFAFTNGYLTNITLINVPRVVDESAQELASSLMAAFVGFGCAAGSFLSLLILKIL